MADDLYGDEQHGIDRHGADGIGAGASTEALELDSKPLQDAVARGAIARSAAAPASPDARDLTARQRMVLDSLIELMARNGYPPTTRELCLALGVRSTNGVHEHLQTLERKGWLDRDGGTSRGIRLRHHPDPGARWSRQFGEGETDGEAQTVALAAERAGQRGQGRAVAVLGRVAAGVPIPAIEAADEVLVIDQRLCGGGDTFALRVVGRSMVDAGILPQDLVLVQPCARVDNGKIAVVDLDGEVTVKRFYAEAGGVRLVAENREMAPIVLDRAAAARLRVVGEVRGVVRTLH